MKIREIGARIRDEIAFAGAAKWLGDDASIKESVAGRTRTNGTRTLVAKARDGADARCAGLLKPNKVRLATETSGGCERRTETWMHGAKAWGR